MMRIVAFLPADHKVDCGVNDMAPSKCDCGEAPIPLVTLYEAENEIQAVRHVLYAEIERLRAAIDKDGETT